MPRVWLAIFFGYRGTNFHGFQHQTQHHVSTVEDLLVARLYLAGFLPSRTYGQLERKDRWSRAARTDKGVHAVLNGISCLFQLDPKYYEDDLLNKNRLYLELKEVFDGTQIVFHAVKRVTNRFQIRMLVKSRQYSYVCPKILFQKAQSSLKKEEKELQNEEHHLELEQKSQNLKQKLKIKQQTINLLQKLNQCCRQFIGTHNFHNYSKNLKSKDPQSHRFVIDFKCEQLNNEYLKFTIIGQSFIYHMIRKIIGCIVMIFVNQYPPSFIPNTLFRNQIAIPLAPPYGLFLDSLSFEAYNKKLQIPQPLIFDDCQTIRTLRQDIAELIQSKGQEDWIVWLNQLKQQILLNTESYLDRWEEGCGLDDA